MQYKSFESLKDCCLHYDDIVQFTLPDKRFTYRVEISGNPTQPRFYLGMVRADSFKPNIGWVRTIGGNRSIFYALGLRDNAKIYSYVSQFYENSEGEWPETDSSYNEIEALTVLTNLCLALFEKCEKIQHQTQPQYSKLKKDTYYFVVVGEETIPKIIEILEYYGGYNNKGFCGNTTEVIYMQIPPDRTIKLVVDNEEFEKLKASYSDYKFKEVKPTDLVDLLPRYSPDTENDLFKEIPINSVRDSILSADRERLATPRIRDEAPNYEDVSRQLHDILQSSSFSFRGEPLNWTI